MKSEEKTVFKKLGDIISTQFSAAEQLIIDAYKSITTPVAVKAAEVKTKDGKALSYEGDTLEGAMISEVTEGGLVPLVTGDYELEDGTLVSVLDGKVTSVKKIEVEVEPADMSAVQKEFATQMSAQKIALENQVNAQAKEIADLKGIVVTMSTMIKEISEAPIGGEISKEVVNEDWMKKPYEQMSNFEKLKFNRQN
jgi:hypothetical protein